MLIIVLCQKIAQNRFKFTYLNNCPSKGRKCHSEAKKCLFDDSMILFTTLTNIND